MYLDVLLSFLGEFRPYKIKGSSTSLIALMKFFDEGEGKNRRIEAREGASEREDKSERKFSLFNSASLKSFEIKCLRFPSLDEVNPLDSILC